MRTLGRTTLLVALLGIATSATAQEGRIGQLYFSEVAPKNNAAWLEAYQKHVEFHRQNNDDWEWPIWVIASGPRSGQYAVGTFAHEWKDFDRAFSAKDMQHAMETTVPLSEGFTSEFWNYLPDRSRPPESTEHSLLVVNYSRIKAGMNDQYWRAVDKINAALEKADWPRRSWTSTIVNSGRSGWVVRVSPRSGYSDMGPPQSSKTFPQAMSEAYGEGEFEAIMESLRQSIDEGYSEIWTFLPDLSYGPGN